MKIISLIFLLHMVSCSTYIRTLGTRMISPEAQGRFMHGTADAIRIQSFQTNQMNFGGSDTRQKLEGVEGIYGAGIGAELGLFKRLDAYILPSLIMSPTIYGLKFQLLGDNRHEAKQGNFSLAVLAGLGSSSEERKDSDEDLDVIDGQIDEIKMDMDHSDVGLIVGYRWTDKLLHYANALYIDERVEGEVTNNNETLMQAPFKFNNHGMLYSMGAILYLKVIYFKLDYSHLISDWSYTRKQYSNSINGGFGFHW